MHSCRLVWSLVDICLSRNLAAPLINIGGRVRPVLLIGSGIALLLMDVLAIIIIQDPNCVMMGLLIGRVVTSTCRSGSLDKVLSQGQLVNIVNIVSSLQWLILTGCN